VPESGGPPTDAPVGEGVPGDNFNRPTDVAWDAAGNIFVSDGYGNSRVAKFDKNGKFIKSWGSKGTAPGQFNTLHTIATDAAGRYTWAIGEPAHPSSTPTELQTQFLTGAPWVFASPSAPSIPPSNSNATANMDDGEIYKMELDGTILGKFGRAGKLPKEFGSTHEIDWNENAHG
jgi:DNA-binding beta-propeller fold protein YncE